MAPSGSQVLLVELGSLCRSRRRSGSGGPGGSCGAGRVPVAGVAGKGRGCGGRGFLEAAGPGSPQGCLGLRGFGVRARHPQPVPEKASWTQPYKAMPCLCWCGPAEVWGRALRSAQALPKSARVALGVQGCGVAPLPPPRSITHGDRKGVGKQRG